MEAQRISLSQIHAAQLELLQEETDASLDLRLHHLREQSGPGKPVSTTKCYRAASSMSLHLFVLVVHLRLSEVFVLSQVAEKNPNT